MAIKKKKYKKKSAFIKKINAKIRKDINQKHKALFESTTLEQRKKLVELLHSGLTFGEASKQAEMGIDTAMIVYKRNTKTVKASFLVKVEDVK